ncbi:MAG TPA: hypothetical protein VFI96_07860, partial [Longimicrobiaceae bacterium]|nr:hypothetical protein [Longimicrobiaceae bacterium]
MNDISFARRASVGRLWLAALIAALGVAVQPAAASAQSVARTDTAAQRLPFAPGEYAKYKVKLGAFTVGHGTMQILGVESVRGRPAFHARL